MLQGNIVTLHQNLSGVREDALNLADVGVAVFVNHDDFLLLCLLPDHPHLPADHEDHHAEIENNQPSNQDDGAVAGGGGLVTCVRVVRTVDQIS